MKKISKGDQFQNSFCFLKKTLYELKAEGLQLSFNIFRYSSTQHTLKTNCIKLQTLHQGVCSILDFQKRMWEQFSHHILCMVFHEKYFLYYILSTDLIFYLSLYFLIKMYLEIVCFLCYDGINFEINLIFVIKLFFTTKI